METAESRKQHTGWNLMVWHLLELDAPWGVPRSGLILRKTANGFNLDSVMPYTPEMAAEAKRGADLPKSAEELKTYQLNDFACMQRYMEAAGLELTDTKALLEAQV